MNKKAIIILVIIFILIIGTLGFIIYSKNSSNSPSPAPTATQQSTTTPTTGNLSTTTPVSQLNGAVQLSSDQVVWPILYYDNSGLSYFDNQGNLYQSGLQLVGKQLQMTDKKQLNVAAKPNITKVLWPSKGNDFIAQFTNSAGQQQFSYFNSSTGVYTDLPPQITSLDWLPGGKQILYVWLQNGKSTLNIGNPDSTNWKYIADMWENDDEIHISPDGSQVLYFETNAAGTTNNINSVSSDGKIWKSLVKNGFNLGVLWSPDGQKFLFGKKDINTQAYQLWLDNVTSGEVINLGLVTTPDKVVWGTDSNIIYAAVPQNPNAGNLTIDSFYKLDTTSLQKTQYQSGASPIDGKNLMLSNDGAKLIFTNAQTGGLYYLNLNQ